MTRKPKRPAVIALAPIFALGLTGCLESYDDAHNRRAIECHEAGGVYKQIQEKTAWVSAEYLCDFSGG